MPDTAFTHYLETTPAEYAAKGEITLDRIFADLIALHGKQQAQLMGLAYLAHSLQNIGQAEQAHAQRPPTLHNTAGALTMVL